MFWPTERCGNSASDWNTRQVGRRFAGRSLMRWPRSRMSPSLGVSMPASMRRSVVLPEPDGPTIGEELALAHLEVDAVDGRQLAERPADADELQDRRRRRHRDGQPRARLAAVIRSSALS